MTYQQIRCIVFTSVLLLLPSIALGQDLDQRTVSRLTSRFGFLAMPSVREELAITDEQFATLMESARADVPALKKIRQADEVRRKQIGQDADLQHGAILMLTEDLNKHALTQEAAIKKILDQKQFKRFREIVFQQYIWLEQYEMGLAYAGRGKAKDAIEKLQIVDVETKSRMQQLRLRMYLAQIRKVVPTADLGFFGELFAFQKKSDIRSLFKAIGSGVVR